MNIDALLQRRSVPPMRSDLTARIIAEAARTPQEHLKAAPRLKAKPGAARVKGWWANFVDGFALPQPALVMTLVLLTGVVAGVGLESVDTGSGFEEDEPAFGVVVFEVLDMEGLS